MSSTLPLWRARAWLVRWSFALLALAGLALAAQPARAQEDPPGRVGRLAELQGSVSWYDHEEGTWSEAERNRPLTGGDRLSTGPQARAELRVGSTVLRLAAGTELEVLRLDDERMSFQLHTGSLALRVRSRDVASEIEIVTTEVRLQPERAGHYRIDRVDDTTHAGVWRGSLRIDDAEGFILETGQRAELWRERRSLRFAWSKLPGDAFAEWVARDDARDERSASSRYVSPEMTGAEDLDRYGRWETHPEYGPLWYPLQVGVDWAPYRQGHWAWVRPWGWTWVDEAPWGFAPFHYGRWVHWGGRWGWAPGDRVARPVYAPALVAWVGGGNFSVSVQIGGPTVGWVPLSPRDWYVPHYRHTPVYVDRVNPRPPPGRPGWKRPGPLPSSGAVVWGNQTVPGAVTVVPRDVLVQRRPVARGVIDTRDWQRSEGRAALPWVAPPAREAPPPRVRDPRDNREPAPRVGPPSPGSAPQPGFDRGERPGERDRERDRDRATRPSWRSDPPAAASPPVAVPVQPFPQPAPQAGPRPTPSVQPAEPPRRERDRDRDRDRVQPQPQPQVQPVPSTSPAAPAVPVPPPRERERPRGPEREPDGGPVRTMPGPASPGPAAPAVVAPPRPAPPAAQVPAPQPAPAAAPAVPPARSQPTSPPERAREREAERERAREQAQAREEERKRAPEGNRGSPRQPEREK